MISYTRARALLEARASVLPVRLVALASVMGRIAAEDIAAGFAVPSFNNSAMDGFAVRAADCTQMPLRLPVCGFLAAGGAACAWQAGQAVQIMTGAAVPDGADSIIPIEDVTVERRADGTVASITLAAAPKLGAHIRRSGEDWQPSERLLRAGEKIAPHHVMGLAVQGIGAVAVREMPRIIVLTTGDEVLRVGEDCAGQPPGGNRIYDTNSPFLLSAARQFGAEAVDGGHIQDTRAAFAQALREIIARGRPGEMVLSTGAVSKGDLDFIPAALADVGAEIIFHRVAIRPGKPVLFALLPGGLPFFGLPGNPVSAAVGFRFFVVPLLRAAMGIPPERPWRLPLSQDYACKPGLRLFLKARLVLDDGGRVSASVLPGQESFRIQPLVRANGWIVRSEEEAALKAGRLVDVYPADPLAATLELT